MNSYRSSCGEINFRRTIERKLVHLLALASLWSVAPSHAGQPIADTDRALRVEGLEVEVATDLLLGDSVPITVTGTLETGDSVDLTSSYLLHARTQPQGSLDYDGPSRQITVLKGGPVRLTLSFSNDAWLPALAEVDLIIRLPGDRDADGMSDAFEEEFGLDADQAADAVADYDEDGLRNLREFQIGTSPRNPDTDGDRRYDGIEVAEGTDPLLPEDEPNPGDLDQNCVVSVLNRTAAVNEEGVWVISNVPSSFGQVRVRANCLEDDGVRTGQSEFVTVPTDGVVRINEFEFDQPEPIPATLELEPSEGQLTADAPSVQLSVIATFPDGSTADLTSSQTGTNYRLSNPAIATLDAEGILTGTASGVVLVTAANEGANGFARFALVMSADSDGDGIPDDLEISLGLDPNDPIDALEDFDLDGLSTLEETQLGTDPNNPDTDADGLADGAEVNDFGTSPLLHDTDGDQFGDGLEIDLGTDPLDPNSFDLAGAMADLRADPEEMLIVVNAVATESFRQLRAVATLIDDFEIDVTSSSYGTQFSSSDLSIASFGSVSGRVFGGTPGVATVTASVAGFEAESAVTVTSFQPTPLSRLDLPGHANGIALTGRYAMIASGSAGLLVVDIEDPVAPRLITAEPSGGNANDLAVAGDHLALADGSAGLALYDLSDPENPGLLGVLALPGDATDVVLEGDLAYVVDELGLRIVDVSMPSSPQMLGSLETPGRARGVDVEPPYVVIADSAEGVHVVDASDPTSPQLLASLPTRPNGTSSAAAVRIDGDRILVADGADRTLGGLRVIDWQIRDNPVVVGSTSDQFGLTGVVVNEGYVFASDYFFANGVPIFQVADDGRPFFRFNFDFSALGDPNGNDLASRDEFVYLVGTQRIADNGVDGSSTLQIGQWAAWPSDDGDEPPTVAILDPESEAQILERREIRITAEASDDVRVARVELEIDGETLRADPIAPYTFYVRAPDEPGSLTLTASAFDSVGLRTESEPVVVEILEDLFPTIEILTPLDGSEVTEGQIAVLAIHATDDDPVGLETTLFVDGLPVANDQRRFEFTVPLGASDFDVTARVRDVLGQTTAAGPVRVHVLADARPIASFLQPADGSTQVQGRFVDVLVGATDDLEVSEVRLDLDGVEVARLFEPPYAVSIRMPTDADAATLTVTAIDSAGRSSDAASISVELLPALPTTQIVGRLLDEFNFPAAGIAVTCSGRGATSSADGTFQVDEVPVDLISGTVFCRAGVSEAGDRSSARSEDVPAVVDGVTDVGDLVLRPHRGYDLPGVLLPMGDRRYTLEVVDLDQDGFDDIVTGGRSCDDGDIVVRWGNDSGKPSEPESLNSCYSLQDLAVFDADGDQQLDLVATEGSGTVSFYRGLGGRSFAPRAAQGVAASLSDLVVADFDLDLVPDLAVVETSADSILILRGQGDGTFAQVDGLPVDSADQLLADDFDGDGWPDLVVADDRFYDLTYFRGSSAGLTLVGMLDPYVLPQSLESMDADLDGLPEVLVAGHIEGASSNRPGALLVFEPGGPTALHEAQRLIVGTGPRSLHAADFDGDGVEEVVLRHGLRVGSAAQPDGLALTATSQGLVEAGGFSAGTPDFTYRSGDVDGDGFRDLISMGSGVAWGDILIVPGDGTGVPVAYVETTGLPLDAVGIATAELDGDGIPDVVTAHDYGPIGEPIIAGLQVSFGVGGGTYRLGPFLPSMAPQGVVIADVDSDGDQDLVTAGFGNDSSTGLKIGGVYVWKGDGAGNFTGGATDFVNAEIPRRIRLADVNDDGILDLIGLSVDIYPSAVHLGRGDGTFAPHSAILSGDNNAVVDVDFDQDGFVDLLIPNFGSSSPFIAFFPGQGDGTFPTRIDLPFVLPNAVGDPNGPSSFDKAETAKAESVEHILAAGNLNDDGIPDLVAIRGGVLAIALGTGGGEIGPFARYSATNSASYLLITDLDRDGRTDILVAGRDLAVLYGLGDGTFKPAQRYSITNSAFDLSDVDGDGDRDVVLFHDTEGDEPPRLLVLPWLP